MKKAREQAVQPVVPVEKSACGSNVQTAAFSQLQPSSFQQVVIGGADGVGVNSVAPGQCANAGQFAAGREVLAQDSQKDLAHQLLANRHFAVLGDPETHAVSSSATPRKVSLAGRAVRPSNLLLEEWW